MSLRKRPTSTLLLIVSLAAAILTIIAVFLFQQRRQTMLVADIVSPPPADTTGFRQALPGVPIVFPEDHGPHPSYQTEWWYFTGNLFAEDGKRFGYQLTIFRRALSADVQERTSNWAADQIYFAHLALTDVGRNRHLASERFSRAGADLAGAESDPMHVWLEDLQIVESTDGAISLTANHEEFSLALDLLFAKAPTLQGEAGYSQKGSDTGNASYYYSYTRLDTSGAVRLDDVDIPVTGSSWMDHEWSTSVLEAGQVGWDWFSLQLDDDREIMVFQMRRDDGTIDPFSSGILVETDGSVVSLSVEDFSIGQLGSWKSPHTDVLYPSGWQLTIPEQELDLTITPVVEDQEMHLSTTYWEGAVDVSGKHSNRPITGVGYAELTGYAESMENRF